MLSTTKGSNIIQTEEALTGLGNTVFNHSKDLIMKKYQVEIKPEEVSVCHHLPGGSIFLRFWNQKQGSSFQQLVQAIKSGKGDKEGGSHS